MLPSPAPHEGPAKDADNAVEPGSLSRFKALTKRLLAVDADEVRKERISRAKKR